MARHRHPTDPPPEEELQNGQPIESTGAADATTPGPRPDDGEARRIRTLGNIASLVTHMEVFVREVRLARVLGERGDQAAVALEKAAVALSLSLHEFLQDAEPVNAEEPNA